MKRRAPYVIASVPTFLFIAAALPWWERPSYVLVVATASILVAGLVVLSGARMPWPHLGSGLLPGLVVAGGFSLAVLALSAARVVTPLPGVSLATTGGFYAAPLSERPAFSALEETDIRIQPGQAGRCVLGYVNFSTTAWRRGTDDEVTLAVSPRTLEFLRLWLVATPTGPFGLQTVPVVPRGDAAFFALDVRVPPEISSGTYHLYVVPLARHLSIGNDSTCTIDVRN